jgi:hypothetical protein
MQFSHLEDSFWAAGLVGEVLLLSILVVRKIYRTFPVFFGWLTFALLSEPTLYWFLHHTTSRTYYQVYFALNFPQYLLEALVLLEIAAKVVQPVRKSLPAGLLYFLALLMFAIGGAGFLIAAHLNSATLAHPRSFMVINMAMAILRLVTFIFIAAFSQVLGLGWKNHVLQLASGLAFYAAVTLLVEILLSHLQSGPAYIRSFYDLQYLRIASYLCSLYYWCYSFSRKEAPRKEFSSKMSELLVSISETAKQQQLMIAEKRK